LVDAIPGLLKTIESFEEGFGGRGIYPSKLAFK
jgi:hypothetical protein